MLSYDIHHVNGLYFQIKDDGGRQRSYDVAVIDGPDGDVLYRTSLKPGGWLRMNRRYLSDLRVEVSYEGSILERVSILERLKGRRVFISFDSAALGDTLAWIPYCMEFSKRYECRVLVSTFKNYMFERAYPEIEFVERGRVVENIVAMFEIGWFYDPEKEPVNPATVPLQQTASNILNLPHREIQPLVDYSPGPRPITEKYVCVSMYSTSQCKLWYHWRELVEHLRSSGYRVIEISKESEMMGVRTSDVTGLEEMSDKSMDSVMTHLHHCEFYVGLSSGLSWLAYGLRKRVYLISNFTDPSHEFTFNTVRISDGSVCNSCWNDPMFKFNKGDWKWCPRHEDTPRQFECHKMIGADKVIQKIVENEK